MHQNIKVGAHMQITVFACVCIRARVIARMFVRVRVSICVTCGPVYVFTRAYACVRAHECAGPCVYVCHMWTRVRAHVVMHVRTHACVYACARASVCEHVRVRTHVYV